MITLFEASKLYSGEMLRSGIIQHFAMSSDLLRALPFINVDGGAYRYNLEGQLPGVAFRGVGESYTASAGILNPRTEALSIVGGDLDVDLATLKMTSEDVRSQHELLKAKAIAHSIADTIINGDSVANPRTFDGLRNRIQGDQIVDAGSTDGGDPLSLVKLWELIDAVDNPTHLIMSKKMRALLSGAAHDPNVGGYISFSEDEFGQRVTMFDNLPILVADRGVDDRQILDFNEVGSGGATATATSVYCVSMGGDGVVGLQNGVMEVRDLGESNDAPVMRTRVEWLVGMAIQHGRSAARLRGISNAAVVK